MKSKWLIVFFIYIYILNVECLFVFVFFLFWFQRFFVKSTFAAHSLQYKTALVLLVLWSFGFPTACFSSCISRKRINHPNACSRRLLFLSLLCNALCRWGFFLFWNAICLLKTLYLDLVLSGWVKRIFRKGFLLMEPPTLVFSGLALPGGSFWRYH